MSAIFGNALDTTRKGLYAMHMEKRIPVLSALILAFLLAACGTKQTAKGELPGQAGISTFSGMGVYTAEEDVRYLLKTGVVVQGNANILFLDENMEFDRTPNFASVGKTFFAGKREGLYRGMAVNGGGLSNQNSLNMAYHGVIEKNPEEILYTAASAPAGTAVLRDLLSGKAAADAN